MNQKTCAVPCYTCGVNTRSLMRDAVIALMPAIFGAVFYQGRDAVRVLLSAALVCCLSDWFFVRLRNAQWDGSALVSGLLLGLLLPASCPWWAAALGALAAMTCKALAGGLGRNVCNPAALGRVVLLVFPSLRPAPLRMASGRFLLGYLDGCLGEVSSLLLAVGAVYLLVRHLLPPHIAGTALAASVLAALWIPRCDPLAVVAWGGSVLFDCFLIVDPVSSPMGTGLQSVYGLVCGVCGTLTAYFWGGVGGACAALLGLNLAFRGLERIMRRRGCLQNAQ